jgi:hypothetical protein
VKKFTIFVLVLLCSGEAFAKKDFKGLFGSYRREKFTENEARSMAFGADLMLSTLFPVTDMVRSQEDTSGTSAPLNYSVFYNVETSLWMSWQYHWSGVVPDWVRSAVMRFVSAPAEQSKMLASGGMQQL